MVLGAFFSDPATLFLQNMVENVHKSRLAEAASDCGIRSAREINVNITFIIFLLVFSVGKFCGPRSKFVP